MFLRYVSEEDGHDCVNSLDVDAVVLEATSLATSLLTVLVVVVVVVKVSVNWKCFPSYPNIIAFEKASAKE